MGLSWLDTLVVFFLLAHTIMGTSRGFVAGLTGLATFAASLAAVLLAAPWLSGAIAPFTGLPGAVVYLVLVIGMGIAVQQGAKRWHRHGFKWLAGATKPWRIANRVLGVLPGAAWGLVSASVLAWLYTTLVGGLPLHSPVSKALLAQTHGPLTRLAARVPARLPAIALLPGGWELVPAVEAASEPPARLEKDMLAELNQARRAQQEAPLEWDGHLGAIADARSRDLLARSYFAHVTPDGQTVADIAAHKGVRYLVIGENLAFAPTLGVAFHGLMQSPEHRENILRRGFHRVGIGIVRVPPGSRYVPREQGRTPMMPLRGIGGYLLVTQVFTN
ncbi:MAG TPA: CAP domain-containing protein [Oscillatoriaceae cyanobacterium]